MHLSKPPQLLGRSKLTGRIHRCAETEHVESESVEYAGAIGGVTVDLYRAQDPKGVGVVLRITSTGDVGCIAHAELIDGGVELHLAGNQAEDSLLGALYAVISKYWVKQKLLRC